jgi:two-component system, cell cycle sensor histidine kinase and response regulator CckA
MQTEAALRDSEKRYRRLVETANEGILTVDSRGTITFANPKMAAMVGCTVDEVTGRPLDAFIFDQEQAPLLRAKLASRSHIDRGVSTWRLLRRDGGATWVKVSAAALPDSEGVGVGALAMVSDITETKQAEDELRLRTTALEAAANAILIGDRNGSIVWTNPAFTALTGYSRSEVLGQSTRLLKSDTMSDASYAAVWDTVLAGRVWKGALVSRRKNGSLYDEGMTITPVLNAGQVTHFIAVKEDVTERRQQEATRARLAEVIEATTDFVGMVDPERNVLYINRAGRLMVGLGEHENLAEMDITVCHPRWAAELVRSTGVPTALRDGVWTGESALLTGDGGEMPVSQVILSHQPTDGGAERLSTIMRDISAQRRAEKALKEQEERLRLAVEGAALATWHWDIATGRETWSDRWYAMFGLAPDSPVTRETFLSMVHADDRDALKAARREALSGSPFDVEYRVLWRDHSEHWIASKGRAYCDASGTAVRMEGVARDVTEHKRLEEHLRQAQKMEAVGRLAGGVAHDFNNLLSVILGYTQLLQRRSDTSESQRTTLAHIAKAGEGAVSLTKQLLAFGRKQVLEPKVLDLRLLISDVVKMISRLIGEDIRVLIVSAPDLGRVQTDPGQLEQVVINLAVNARDAMPNGGTLTFETANLELDEASARSHHDAKAGQYVTLLVRDTGHGMDGATLAHLFEPFFTTKGPGKGTGLGLATVYGIVTQSGGHIRVESEPGKGSTFIVYLPRVDAPAPFAATLATRGAIGSGTILIAEDDDALRELTSEILEAHGYDVLRAANAEEAQALAHVHEGVIDALLTDVVMPGVNGRVLADRLLAQRPHMKVLFMSGYTDDAISHRGVLDPGTLLLRKPFTEQGLTLKLRETLEG